MINFILGIIISAVVTTITLSLSDDTREKVMGVCKHVLGQSEKKENNKQQILEFMETQGGSVTNSQISEHLGVSKRTVIRYMNELEEAGKVTQIGETGLGHVPAYSLNMTARCRV
jgi:predicted HTH transcriptional regulator